MTAPSVSATLARVLSDKPYSNNHAEVGRARELVLKESTLAKEAISVFSGFRSSYNKGDVSGVTRSLGFFGEATNNNDKISSGGGLKRPRPAPPKSELISSLAFQGDYVIDRKVRSLGYTNSTINNEAVTREGTDIPSWRTNSIPYTISEDLSRDCGNQMLSRIGKRKHDSEEIGILTGKSDMDSWSLRHQNEVSWQGSGSIPEPTNVKAQTLYASGNKRSADGLFHHELEAHSMHEHGDKQYLCTYEDCDCSLTGNGFPRHWNLRDHVRRVHNDPGPTKSRTSGSPLPSKTPARGRNKRKAEVSEAAAVEKTVKRIATPPAMAEPSLVDRYVVNEQRLRETVKQLRDPTSSSNMVLYEMQAITSN